MQVKLKTKKKWRVKYVTNTDTRKAVGKKKHNVLNILPPGKAHALVIAQVSSVEPLRNKLNYLKFSNTDGKNTNC